MSEGHSNTTTKPAIIEKTKITAPKMYKVLLLNDDYTSMEFVVDILEQVFKKNPSESVRIMLQVHNSGSGVAGIYVKEIAEAKVMIVHQKAKSAGFPLRCDMEEE